MTRTLYRSVSANVQQTDTVATQRQTILTAWNRADVLKMQEGQDTGQILVDMRNNRDLKFYRPAGMAGIRLPIAWRDSVFQLVASGLRTAWKTPGGGWGPDRGCTWVLLRHRRTGRVVLEVNIHQIHQAFTSHPERQAAWTKILNGVAAEIKRVRGNRNYPPTVISGDMNKATAINFPDLGETEVPNIPPTHGSSKYDRFFLIGGVAARSVSVFATHSDHKAVLVNMEITTAAPAGSSPPAKPVPKARPAGALPLPGPVPEDPPAPKPLPVQDFDIRKAVTFRRSPKWRYFAMRVDGSAGNGLIIHPNLPLQDAEIEDVLTGHNALTGSLSPEIAGMIADDGKPLMDEWGTMIFAEEAGNIHGGGILTHSGFDGSKWDVECTGLTGYAADMPYSSANYFVEVDALDVFRHIWSHIQSQPGGNVGLQMSPTVKSGVLLGNALTQAEFDTQSGPVTFEAGPYKLQWYADHDLSSNLASLATDNGFEWHERHYWDGQILRHYLDLGVPKIGHRHKDLRFVVGENIHQIPSVERDGDDYADEVWVLGAGEGSAMKRGTARKNIGRLRRVAVVADPSLRTQKGVNGLASREIAWRNELEDVESVVVRDHPHADITALQVGDEILVQGKTGWITLGGWYRILSRRIKPQSPDRMELSLIRSDKMTGAPTN